MLKKFLIAGIRLYKLLISPLLGDVCRFTPSCSIYAIGVIKKYGAAKGSWLALKRICRCHPWHPGGYDPP